MNKTQLKKLQRKIQRRLLSKAMAQVLGGTKTSPLLDYFDIFIVS